MSVLQPHRIEVNHEGPAVVLKIDSGVARLEYRTALRVAQYLRLNSRAAQQHVRDRDHWTTIVQKRDEAPLQQRRTLADWLKLIKPARPVTPAKPGKEIKTRTEGEIVYLMLGNTTIGMHYTDALTLAEWLRTHAQKAKALAGDNSKELSILGTLHDASMR